MQKKTTTIFQRNSQLHKCDGINFKVISFVIVFVGLQASHTVRTKTNSERIKNEFPNKHLYGAQWSNLMLKKRNFIANKTVRLFVLEKRLNHLLIHHYGECKLASFVAND